MSNNVKEHCKKEHDFSCWVIKYDNRSIYGRIYQPGSLKSSDSTIVPLLWDHRHADPNSVLGHAYLEHRDEGLYAYCVLNSNQQTEYIKQLIRDKGTLSISPYTYRIKYDGNFIVKGVIKEVSLVLERADPDEDYYPVMRH